MSEAAIHNGSAALELEANGRCAVSGPLVFSTVARLLPLGSNAIVRDSATVFDLTAVTASDSAGLALLIEWLSVARGAGRTLHFESMPSQLQQIARLSEVEDLLSIPRASASVATKAAQAPG